MDLKTIRDEIIFEEKLLDNYKKLLPKLKGGNLISQRNKGCLEFYGYNKKSKKKKYIKKTDPKLTDLYLKRFFKTAVENIESNIKNLKELEKNFKVIDTDAINCLLPKAYQDAFALIGEGLINDPVNRIDKSNTVKQSENPFKRDQLKHKVSNGLYVRSKNELLIAEMLLWAGISFRYEKKLELEWREVNQYGEVVLETKAVYPDFTIFLPNGDVLYWEHEGLMQNDGYREDNIKRLNLYFMNGILIPEKLIVTMDSDQLPFDNNVILKVIENFVLPKMDKWRFI